MTSRLLYDADCSFCTRAVRLLSVLRLSVTISSIQSVDLAALGVSPKRVTREMPLVLDDGSVVYGHGAVAGALASGAPPLRLIARMMMVPPFDRLFALVYRLVATHRHQLPGGTASCALPRTQT